jgi:hypothetical protein
MVTFFVIREWEFELSCFYRPSHIFNMGVMIIVLKNAALSELD